MLLAPNEGSSLLAMRRLAESNGGIGGRSPKLGTAGASSAKDFLRRRKKEDDFFCNAGWFECDDDVSLEAGCEDNFTWLTDEPGCEALCDSPVRLLVLFAAEGVLEEPNTLLKNPGRSLGCEAAALADGSDSFDFP